MTPEYQRLFVAVTGVLGYIPTIDEAMVRHLEQWTRDLKEDVT